MLKKIFSGIMMICATLSGTYAKGWDAELYKQIESRIRIPEFKEKIYDITKFGASAKETAKKNQDAINKAIKECSKNGGGKVVVSGGIFNTGAIHLLSNTNLVINKGSGLLFAFEPDLYPLVKTRWEGLDIMNYSPCIYAYQAENIAITGEGTIDGNGSNATWWQWCGNPRYGFIYGKTKEAQSMPYSDSLNRMESATETDSVRLLHQKLTKLATDARGMQLSNRNMLLKMSDEGLPVKERLFGPGHGMRPQLVNFYECKNILVGDVTLLRSPFWSLTPTLSQNITIHKVKIINNGPNGDGCNPESCEDVLIEDCFFHTGDDCIAIKSGRNADGRRAARCSKNIIIRGCTMEDGHGGVVIGSETSGGVSNIFAENCKMDSPNLERVLRIKTNTCRGGITEGIYLRNITAGQCKEAVLKINLLYEPNEQSERGFPPAVRNIFMERTTCGKSKHGILISGLPDSDNISDITVKDCTFNGVTGEKIRISGKNHAIRFENLSINGEIVKIQ